VKNHHFMLLPVLQQKLENEFRKQQFNAAELDYSSVNAKLGFLKKFTEMDNSSMAIIDFYQNNCLFVKSKMVDLLGYNPDEVLLRGQQYFLEYVHPDDIATVVDSIVNSFVFVRGIPVEQRGDYKTILNFRILSARHESIQLIQQRIVLESDSKGNIWLMQVITDWLPDSPKFARVGSRLINIRNNRFYLFDDEDNAQKSLLSKRELEILTLVSKGMASKDIADQLFISVHTVNNHRQKIIEKMNVENSAEAIAFGKSLGII
jgi:DNA-binding CsgD family transcriptional regulator/PAS domain-containing protein